MFVEVELIWQEITPRKEGGGDDSAQYTLA
jgi:hypothetical protein